MIEHFSNADLLVRFLVFSTWTFLFVVTFCSFVGLIYTGITKKLIVSFIKIVIIGVSMATFPFWVYGVVFGFIPIVMTSINILFLFRKELR